jgi:ribonuclease HII
MFSKIKKIADDFLVLKITAAEIDKMRGEKNLNQIEIAKMQQIINLLHADRVIIDAPEVNTKKFAEKIRAKLRNKKTELVCENYADKKHLPVGAASVIAKVNRDAEIIKLHKKHGFFGSGYSSDERTVAFLKNWIKVNKEFPNFVRKSWATSIGIKKEAEQTKLSSW